MTILDAETCFAVPGEDSIIDMIRPATGRSWINDETLEQIRLRYPKAEIVNFKEYISAKASKQDAEPKDWREINGERYHEMLNVLPPAAMANGAFMVGEPYDHHARTGRPRFACFKHEGEKYFELSSHITLAQFRSMFGHCANTYVE